MRMQYRLCYLVNFFKRKFNTIRHKNSLEKVCYLQTFVVPLHYLITTATAV